jgi:HlyD family secretion protein
MAANKKGINWLRWIFLLLLAGVAAGAWYWYKQKNSEPPVQLKTAAVTRGDVVQAVTANGQLMPVRNVQVGSQVSGIITDIYADFNSHVTNGQVIARIDPSTYQQNITSAEADLQNAKAAEELAQVNYDRAKELNAAQLIPASEFDKAIADLHQAQAVVKTRQAALKRNQVDLEKTTIYSPVDGVVISRAVDVGQTVAASFNTPTLFQIANDLHNMRIEAMVSEADVGGVAEKQNVTFTVDAFPGRQFRGEVSQVRFAPITNQNVVSYTCVVDVNNADLKLRPGMTATASIVTGEKRDVLRIPNAALRFRPSDELLGKAAHGTNGSPAGASRPGGGQQMASGEGAGSGPGGGSPNREEMRRRFENMTPEQREEARKRFRERGGGGGGGGGGRNHAADGPVTRTVYVRDSSSNSGEPRVKAVTIKTGISDGSYTEVLDGLKEGEEIVIGSTSAGAGTAAASAVPQGRSPFGGGFGRRR